MLQRPSLVVQGLKTQQRISKGIIAIHTYRQCNQAANQPAPPKKYDNSIAKFKNELQESHLLKLWSKHRGLWLATPRLALHFLIDTTWPANSFLIFDLTFLHLLLHFLLDFLFTQPLSSHFAFCKKFETKTLDICKRNGKSCHQLIDLI